MFRSLLSLPPGKDLIRKGPNKKNYWRQNTQKNTPCFSDERCRYENGYQSLPFTSLLCVGSVLENVIN